MATAYLGLAQKFDQPLGAIAQFSGVCLINQGMGNIFWGFESSLLPRLKPE